MAARANAGEVWVVRAAALGQPLGQPFCNVVWFDRLTFFNSSDQQATVRLIGVSNGEPFMTPRPLILTSGKTAEVRSGAQGDMPGWQAALAGIFAPVSVAHLDIPDGVVLADKIEVNEFCTGGQPPGSSRALRGSIPFQVHRSLVPAGQRQIHLGVDIGWVREEGANFRTLSNRINVGIYNGGAVSATAAIEIRRSCDDGLIETRTVSVPANAIQQFGGFSNPGTPVGTCNSLVPYQTYVIVTMDQPGFSYAIALSNEVLPFVPVGIGGAS